MVPLTNLRLYFLARTGIIGSGAAVLFGLPRALWLLIATIREAGVIDVLRSLV